MKYGFIYCMGNTAMPDIYKIGMTDRAPSQRCMEISGATGVPAQFNVMCFGEVDDARAVEREIHDALKSFRVSGNREFFFGEYAMFADEIRQYSEMFAESEIGSMQVMADNYRYHFTIAETDAERARILIEAAKFEGIRMWAENGGVMTSRPLSRITWMGMAAYHLSRHLVSILPTEKPCSNVQRLIAKSSRTALQEVAGGLTDEL